MPRTLLAGDPVITITTSPDDTGRTAGDGRPTGALDQVSLQVSRQLRALHTVKVATARGESDAERAMHTVLLVLADGGPQRVTALADQLGTDPSTTSRQTAELVRRGLLERLPDPDDRRAGLLAVTDEGRAVVLVMRERRSELLTQTLRDWSAADVEMLATFLGRFADSLERTRTEMTSGTWPASSGRPAATTDHVEETA